MMYHFGSSWLPCFVLYFVLCLVMRFSCVFPQEFHQLHGLSRTHFSVFSCHNLFSTFLSIALPAGPGRACCGQRRWAKFIFILCLQISQFMLQKIRTVIFEFLYVPLPDCWPWERPILTTLNWDLYHFSITCCAFHRPCVTFLTVDTPSIALSSASDSS